MDHDEPGSRSVADLTVGHRPGRRRGRGPRRPPADVKLASGRKVENGYTLNGTSPGPPIDGHRGRAARGAPDQRERRRRDHPALARLDVPNAEDGVAGVTQDAVQPGEEHTYRFVADQAGSYWYHSHQVSHEQVRRGLLRPARRPPPPGPTPRSWTSSRCRAHATSGTGTLNGHEGDCPGRPPSPASTCASARSTRDNGPVRVWSGAPYRVLAVDATDVHEPTEVDGQGGHTDRRRTRGPRRGGARRRLGRAGPGRRGERRGDRARGSRRRAAVAEPSDELDLLSYGSPAPLGFDPGKAVRSFHYDIGRRPGLRAGQARALVERSTATCSRTCRCTSSTRATW